MTPTPSTLSGWDRLRHGGLLLDETRLRQVAAHKSKPLSAWLEKELRKQTAQVQDGTLKPSEFVAFVLEHLCGFTEGVGRWQRGSAVDADWARPGVAGDQIKPRHLWRGDFGATVAVFIDQEPRLGVGRSARAVSQTLQWLRSGRERIAILTNGGQWRLVFAGLDFDAWCQWDVDLWFEEGAPAPQVEALRTLLQPVVWTPAKKDQTPPLAQAILDSRKGQAELSAVLGERVREAVEVLLQAHGEVFKHRCADVDPADIYRAAVRIVMRLVVVLFAESRETLLPRSNPLYYGAYSLTGLREELDKVAARAGSRLKRSHAAWPRLLALFRLVHDGSHHPDLPVREYGGELFGPGRVDAADGLTRALAVFESASLEQQIFTDHDVQQMLELLTKTLVRISQGRGGTWVKMPVDFSDLSSEYIGILYEGLLDFELRRAPQGDPVVRLPGDPIVFLAVGNQAALPLSRLEGMDDDAIASLLEKMKDKAAPVGGGDAEDAEEDAEVDEGEEAAQTEDDEIEDEGDDEAAASVEASGVMSEPESDADRDVRFIMQSRAEEWARRAVQVGKLVAKPRGAPSETKRRAYDEQVARKAAQIVARVVLPGEWYLVRWGGTRKGSGTFYTRPGLAVPTVHRTLRPMAYDPPVGVEGEPNVDAPASAWTPKSPEQILGLKVCDPACGSGTFPVAVLRYLTEALYASLHHHGRIAANNAGDRSVIRLLDPSATTAGPAVRAEFEGLSEELLPCRPDDPTFELRLKAILRRHVVERCLYGVDLDPLAVELCRLALWIETMDRDLPFSFLDHKVKCGNGLVGAWFDTFRHYPVMAWKNREGGDKSHTNGVHYQKEARTKAIKAFVRERLTPDLQTWIRLEAHENRQLFGDASGDAVATQQAALDVFTRLHQMPVHAAGERARVYRDEVVGSAAYQAVRAAMDLWCACWFWPVSGLADAPLPTTMAAPGEGTRALAGRVAAAKRFFHWELEFPDVFNASRAGFDAILGNPPWENLQPNPEEYFSNRDPLFRTYGRLQKNEYVRQLFSEDADAEGDWLDYCAGFASFAHWIGTAANPFGDPASDLGSDTFSLPKNGHDAWRTARRSGPAFSDPAHPYRFQVGRIFTYKLFLEQTYALLRPDGRFGQIVPSGICSDSWSQRLRELFLDRCRWEWLFGFENRDTIFDIHRSFKFNPVIVQKGGETRTIRTAFMRRRLEDWEAGESFATPYTREQVERFSPRSKAILEIQSTRDLEILEKIYANSVLLGDDGPNGWGLKYKLEFMMNTDAHLFPPRPKWEAQGYRPDEYNRWLKGDWRPMGELWRELKVDPSKVVPIDPERARRIEADDVQKTDHPARLRCAQPPYDRLPIPRTNIPAGIILSREADAWIRAEGIEDVALPLYEGRMIGQFDFSEKGWVSGKGRSAVWREIDWSAKQIEPQYLMAQVEYDRHEHGHATFKIGFMDVTSSTNTRTVIAACLGDVPCGHKAPILTPKAYPVDMAIALAGVLDSLVFDWVVRVRFGGTSLIASVLEEVPVVTFEQAVDHIVPLSTRLSLASVTFAKQWLDPSIKPMGQPWRRCWAVTPHERRRIRARLDAHVLGLLDLSIDDARYLFLGCDQPRPDPAACSSKGFWRIDKQLNPECRHPIVTLAAFADLIANKKAGHPGRSPVATNLGEEWAMPGELRLVDYGLGHDERAHQPKPVASRLGPRFYDWQLAQDAEESWRECEVHARNLDAGTVGSQGSRPPEGDQRTPPVAPGGLLGGLGDG